MSIVRGGVRILTQPKPTQKIPTPAEAHGFISVQERGILHVCICQLNTRNQGVKRSRFKKNLLHAVYMNQKPL